jgi:hypothetical protein
MMPDSLPVHGAGMAKLVAYTGAVDNTKTWETALTFDVDNYTCDQAVIVARIKHLLLSPDIAKFTTEPFRLRSEKTNTGCLLRMLT